MVACSSLGHQGLGGVLHSECGILITSEGLRVCILAMYKPVNIGEEKESNLKLLDLLQLQGTRPEIFTDYI